MTARRGGRPYAMKLTAAGFADIAVEAEQDEDNDTSTAELARPSETTTDAAAANAADPAPVNEAPLATQQPDRAPSAPREGTKLAQVIGLLIRDRGATLAELIAATEWLPHTTKTRGSVYVIAADAAVLNSAAPPAAPSSNLAPALASVAAPDSASSRSTTRSKRGGRRTERDAATIASTGPAA